jgi:hypothetical protein
MLQWERRETNLVTLVIPKFRNRWVVRWFVPMLAKPNVRVNLDRFGSYFWEHCDGVTSVGDIGEEMAREFNEPLESMYDRLSRFALMLERDHFINFAGNPANGVMPANPDVQQLPLKAEDSNNRRRW